MAEKQSDYYRRRYRSAAIRYIIAGVVGVAAGAAVRYSAGTGGLGTMGLIVAVLGVFLIALGWSSMRDNNMVKAFAQQCIYDPSRVSAEGLLEVLSAQHRLHLVQASISLIDQAIEEYANGEEADEDLVQALWDAKNAAILLRRF